VFVFVVKKEAKDSSIQFYPPVFDETNLNEPFDKSRIRPNKKNDGIWEYSVSKPEIRRATYCNDEHTGIRSPLDKLVGARLEDILRVSAVRNDGQARLWEGEG